MTHEDLIYRVLSVIFPVVIIVSVGYFYSRRFKLDMAASNRLNIDVFVPMLIFDIMSSGKFALADYTVLALGGALVILGSGLLTWPLARLLGYQWKTFLPPMMFSNSGNMGLPILLLAFGEQALPAAVVLFVLENFLHFSLGQRMLDHRGSLLSLLKNPMIVATIGGIAISELAVPLPEIVKLPIHMLGQVSIPLMLFSLGVRLTALDLRDWRIGLTGAVACPVSGLAIALLILPWLSLPEAQVPILIVFSVLPPAVINFLIAEQYNQEPQLVASIVLIGNLAAVIAIPLTLWFTL